MIAETRIEGKRSFDCMTPQERSLLMYLETCAVDHSGIVDTARMNSQDIDAARAWAAAGLIKFCRVLSVDLRQMEPRPEARCPSHVVEFGPLAWEAAGRERQRRAERMKSAAVKAAIAHRRERELMAAMPEVQP